MARKGWWIRSSAVVTYSVSVSYQIDRSEISSELTFNAVCALRVISQQNEEIWHPSSPLPGGGGGRGGGGQTLTMSVFSIILGKLKLHV